MEITDKTNLPLNGVRIVDWSIRATGPSATALLADMGAEVIKVETLDGGDPDRGASKDATAKLTLPNGLPYNFLTNNRNKKSIAVDLTKEEGKQIIYSLVANADIFVQNFRYGVAKKLKMDYETLQKHNPSLVYANCTGYGRKGKQVTQSAMDATIHGASGLMLGIGEPDMPPIAIPGAINDQVTALMLVNGIMIALFHRERTGEGQEINVAMLGTMIWVQKNNLLTTILAKKARPRQLRSKPSNPLVNHYRCQDGLWIVLGMFQVDKYWSALCRALGLNELIDDPRFNKAKGKEQHSAELVSLLDKAFASKTRPEWISIFQAADLLYSPVRDYWEVVNDPDVLENGFIVEYDYPGLGKIKDIGIPIELSKTPGSIRETAPQLGQHTEEILIELLGYSWEDIQNLQGKSVIL